MQKGNQPPHAASGNDVSNHEDFKPQQNAAGGSKHLDSGVLPGENALPALSHGRMLNDKNFSDVVVTIAGRRFTVHSYVIQLRCEALFNAKQKSELEKKKNKDRRATLQVDFKDLPPSVTPQSLFNIFEYAYAGAVNFSSLSQADVHHLNIAAKHFSLTRLSYFCEKYLQETLTIQNVFNLLKLAADTNEASVKTFCIGFALQNFQSFITNKDGIRTVGIDLFQEVVTKSADASLVPKPKEQPVPPNTYLSSWKQLHDESLWYDAVARVGTERIKFHRGVLAAHSDALGQFLLKNPGEEVEIKGLTPEAFKQALRFIYYGWADVQPLPATELIPFATQYNLPELGKICEEKIKDSVSIPTVLEILGVTYLPNFVERQDMLALRKRCIAFVIDNLSQVDIRPLKKMIALQIPLDILFAVQARERGEKADESHSSAHVPPSPGRSDIKTASNSTTHSEKPAVPDREPEKPQAPSEPAQAQTSPATGKAVPTPRSEEPKPAPVPLGKQPDTLSKKDLAAVLKKQQAEDAAKRKEEEKKQREEKNKSRDEKKEDKKGKKDKKEDKGKSSKKAKEEGEEEKK